MSGELTAGQTGRKTPDAVLSCAVDFGSSVAGDLSGHLDAGELLTGVPTIAVQTKTAGADDVTFSQIALNTAARLVAGRQCAAGEVVQFRVSGGTAGATYLISVKCSTDASPARTVEGFITVVVQES